MSAPAFRWIRLAAIVAAVFACRVPHSDRRLARHLRPAQLRGSTIMIAPLAAGMLKLNAGFRPAPELLSAAQRRFGVHHPEPLAADLYQRQFSSALHIAKTLRLDVRFSIVSRPAYHQLMTTPDAWLSIGVDETTFQVPKQSTLETVGGSESVDLALGLRIGFERERRVYQRDKLLHAVELTVCTTDFVLWEYESERVLAVGRVKSSIPDQPATGMTAWKWLEHSTMEQILDERPFVDN